MTLTDRYRRPADLPARIPVFPLRGAILLPRATLPLNIFEPRFLEMIDDVMSGGRVIGILQPLVAGDDDQESPLDKTAGLRSVGCAGRVTSYQELDDGRLIITLTGIIRFESIGETETDKPYRIMSASYDRFANDLTEGLGEELVDRQNLLRVLKTYLEVNRLKTDWASIQRASNEFLINALSVMCPYGPEEKQALLEARDLRSRAEVLVALAEIDLASNGSSGTTLQ
ncbi:LON peptidase substrate-binding domain-containing protein [Hyphomicrobium sp.]|uniref:LON peptidase substrate-binding domain-containing protein n=1 Tax=Hyphomicrobium sp. TaxID=82 RepID=UPI002C2761C0|nr:LON peptidase substrate-binding domain-containing protein [Hyphomicrobium sp.]HVZ05960.1 LON peptidase substrate-binding domain-containing protein [Hyphomicrobium sp.]